MRPRILLQHLVGRVAMADPELVLIFLPPAQRRRRAADFDDADRSCGRRRPGRPRTRPSRRCRTARSTDARSSTLMSTRSNSSLPVAAANASRAPRGFLRCGTDVVMSPSTCVMRRPADVLRQIAPVRSDVAERRRRAALVGLEAPGIVRVLEQPVLKVVAVHEARRADFAASRSRAAPAARADCRDS